MSAQNENVLFVESKMSAFMGGRGPYGCSTSSAIEFLELFGPLVEGWGEGIVGVDLNEFWIEQRRFCLVSRLHESREESRGLRKALGEYLNFAARPPWTEAEIEGVVTALRKMKAGIGQKWSITAEEMGRISEISEQMGLPVNPVKRAPNASDLILAEELEQARSPSPKVNHAEEKHPPTYEAEQFRHYLETGENPRTIARYFVKQNIQFFTKGVRFSWEAGLGGDADKFYPPRHFDSLLTAILDLFAADTAGVAWRICPIDGNMFYPPRTDRICCTTTEQVRWSKVQYEERRKRKRRGKSRRRGRGKKC